MQVRKGSMTDLDMTFQRTLRSCLISLQLVQCCLVLQRTDYLKLKTTGKSTIDIIPVSE